MLSPEEIALMLNEYMLKELENALTELKSCTSLAQARGGLHNRVEAYTKSNKALKEKLCQT